MNGYNQILYDGFDLDEARRYEALMMAVTLATTGVLQSGVTIRDAAKKFEEYLKGDGSSKT